MTPPKIVRRNLREDLPPPSAPRTLHPDSPSRPPVLCHFGRLESQRNFNSFFGRTNFRTGGGVGWQGCGVAAPTTRIKRMCFSCKRSAVCLRVFLVVGCNMDERAMHTLLREQFTLLYTLPLLSRTLTPTAGRSRRRPVCQFNSLLFRPALAVISRAGP